MKYLEIQNQIRAYSKGKFYPSIIAGYGPYSSLEQALISINTIYKNNPPDGILTSIYNSDNKLELHIWNNQLFNSLTKYLQDLIDVIKNTSGYDDTAIRQDIQNWVNQLIEEINGSISTLLQGYASTEDVLSALTAFLEELERANCYYCTLYTLSDSEPDKPDTTTYDFATSTLTPTSGWKTSALGLQGKIWYSSKLFIKNGTSAEWTTPIELVNSESLLSQIPSATVYPVSIYLSTDTNLNNETITINNDAVFSNGVLSTCPTSTINNTSYQWALQPDSTKEYIWVSYNNYRVSNNTVSPGNWTTPIPYQTFEVTSDIIASAIAAQTLNINNKTYFYDDGSIAFSQGTHGAALFNIYGYGYLAGRNIEWGYYDDSTGNFYTESIPANNHFKLKVTGIIEASGGHIGGWTIADNYLYSEIANNNETRKIQISPDEIHSYKDNGDNTITDSWILHRDGSGILANGNISWGSDGTSVLRAGNNIINLNANNIVLSSLGTNIKTGFIVNSGNLKLGTIETSTETSTDSINTNYAYQEFKNNLISLVSQNSKLNIGSDEINLLAGESNNGTAALLKADGNGFTIFAGATESDGVYTSEVRQNITNTGISLFAQNNSINLSESGISILKGNINYKYGDNAAAISSSNSDRASYIIANKTGIHIGGPNVYIASDVNISSTLTAEKLLLGQDGSYGGMAPATTQNDKEVILWAGGSKDNAKFKVFKDGTSTVKSITSEGVTNNEIVELKDGLDANLTYSILNPSQTIIKWDFDNQRWIEYDGVLTSNTTIIPDFNYYHYNAETDRPDHIDDFYKVNLGNVQNNSAYFCEYDDAGLGNYFFDPLSIGSVISGQSLSNSINLILPCMRPSTDLKTKSVQCVYGVKRDGTPYTLTDIRKCLGKKFYIIVLDTNGNTKIQIKCGKINGGVNLIKDGNDYVDSIDQPNQNEGFMVLECKAFIDGTSNPAIGWEVTYKAFALYDDSNIRNVTFSQYTFGNN